MTEAVALSVLYGSIVVLAAVTISVSYSHGINVAKRRLVKYLNGKTTASMTELLMAIDTDRERPS